MTKKWFAMKNIAWLFIGLLLLVSACNSTEYEDYENPDYGDLGEVGLSAAEAEYDFSDEVSVKYSNEEESAEYPSSLKIAQSAAVSMDVDERAYDAVKQGIHDIITPYNGYVSSAIEKQIEPRSGAPYRTYSLTLEVPAEHLQEVFAGITELGEITSSQMNAVDMSKSYQNNEEKLASAKALKQRMEELLDKAENFNDVMKIEEKLFKLDQDIASYEKALENIDFDVDYADIKITVTEKKEGVQYMFTNFLGINELLKNVLNSFEHLLEAVSKLFAYLLVIAVVVYIWKRKKK